MNRRLLPLGLLLAALLPQLALAQGTPAALLPELAEVERLALPEVDLAAARRADEARVQNGRSPHYAVALEVDVSPWQEEDKWELVGDDQARWRLRLTSPGALSLNLAFSHYRMPPGGRLTLLATDGHPLVRPFTHRDNEEHGQLWTPPVLTDDLIVEVMVPVDRLDELELQLVKVHHGYAGFGEKEPKSGPCQLDAACSRSEVWGDPARSVALISVAGVSFCSGFLVNNTALDGRPLLITAQHCGVNRRNGPSVVVFWNHESPVCRDGGEALDGPVGNLSQFQTGAIFRALHRASDLVLLELDDPPPAAFKVFYAGWDRSPADPQRTVAIHHPNTDVKRVSFDHDRALTTLYFRDEPHARGTHLRIGAWEQGTTEGGSSGAPLFNQDLRVVGQLHGGYATCDDRRADWFGRLSAAWDGDGRPGTRLSDWLDPLATGTLTLDGLDASAVSVAE